MTLDDLIREVFKYMDEQGQLDKLKKKYPAANDNINLPKNNSPPD